MLIVAYCSDPENQLYRAQLQNYTIFSIFLGGMFRHNEIHTDVYNGPLQVHGHIIFSV